MNETATRLRAQKAYSTDPDYLERLALAEEARTLDATRTKPVPNKSAPGQQASSRPPLR